jgi:phage baseplate assembly protein W
MSIYVKPIIMNTINIKFPLVDDVNTNTYFMLTKITKDALVSDLMLLLLTERGERYYEPDYGTNLLRYIFEPNDGQTSENIEQEIKRVVSLYIPALTINKVTFNWNYDDNGEPIPDTQINVNIKFTYTEDVFSEGGSIDLNF